MLDSLIVVRQVEVPAVQDQVAVLLDRGDVVHTTQVEVQLVRGKCQAADTHRPVTSTDLPVLGGAIHQTEVEFAHQCRNELLETPQSPSILTVG